MPKKLSAIQKDNIISFIKPAEDSIYWI